MSNAIISLSKLVILIFIFNFFSTSILYADQLSVGTIELSATGKQQAQSLFKLGVAELHNFQYQEAITAFSKAIAADPNMTMAYWGLAMSHNQPVWNEQDYIAGRNALNRLDKNPDERIVKAKTPIEKGFIAAVNALYSDMADKTSRDTAYFESMSKLHNEYPDNIDITAFYALSLLGITQGERNSENYMKAASLLEEAFIKSENHPGVLHYLIHSYDDPIHAPLGLRAAHRYAKVAPDAPHALHMPSHIYLALGMWNETISSNKAVWEAGKKEIKKNHRDQYAFDGHALHGLAWLTYAELQINKPDEALKHILEIEIISHHNNNPMVSWNNLLMQSEYILATQSLPNIPQPKFTNETEYGAVSSYLSQKAMYYIQHDQLREAKHILDLIQNRIQSLPTEIANRKHATTYATSQFNSSLQLARIYKYQILGGIAEKNGKFSDAEQYLKRALDIEKALPFGYGPPMPVQPTYELLARLYAKNNMANAACDNYKNQLKRTPNRYITLTGMKQLSTKGYSCNPIVTTSLQK